MEKKSLCCWQSIVAILLPAVGYLLCGYLVGYYEGDKYHTVIYEVSYWISYALDLVFPYLSLGLACSAVARRGFRGQTLTVVLACIGILMPYLCQISKNLLLYPSLLSTGYLKAAGLYTLVNYAAELVLFLAVLVATVFVGLKFSPKKTVGFSLITMASVLFLIALALNIADTVEFVHEQLYEYYDEISRWEIITLILSYMKIIAVSGIGFLLMLYQDKLLFRQKSAEQAETAK